MVDKVFLGHDVDPGHGQRGVGAGTHLQHLFRTGAYPRDARVDADELRAELAHHLHDGVAVQAVGVAAQGLLAPQHDDLGRHPAFMVVAVVELLRIVDLGIAAADHERRVGHARPVARPAGLRVDGIGRAEHEVGPLRIPVVRLAARATEHADGLGAVLLRDLQGGVSHQIGRLVPRTLLPLVQATVFAGALHRVDDAVGMVDVLRQRQAARTQRTLGDGVLGVAFDLDHLAVLHMHLQSASHGMASRRRPSARPKDGFLAFLPLPLRHVPLLPPRSSRIACRCEHRLGGRPIRTPRLYRLRRRRAVPKNFQG